jgi:plastocyanin
MKLGVIAAIATAGAAVLPAVALGGAHASHGHTVILKEIRFHPGTLTIRRGDSVTWLWRDEGIEHNVTFNHFHSRTQGSGSFTVRFNHRGTFNYHCSIHVSEGMKGKIVVH